MAGPLFIADRHEALRGAPWSEAAARDASERIAAASCAAFDPQSLWPTHPRDRSDVDSDVPFPMLYCGAAGAIWALQRLQHDAMAALPVDFVPTIAGLLARSRRFNAAAGLHPASYVLGEAGVLLLQWKQLRDPAAADALYALAESNLHHPTLEALWGSSGTLIAVIHMLEDLPPAAQVRWGDVLQRGAEILLGQMHAARHSSRPQTDVWMWTQDLYGKQVDYLGSGHGFAGNVYPAVRGARWLDAALVERFEARALQTLGLVAERDGDTVNWQPVFDPVALGYPRKFMLQDCHGAPGIVCRLAGARSPALRELMRQGGEAVWAAGPLTKPPGLCHGTDGNGYALLKLHALTGEARWLERARAFAMHAVLQSQQEEKVHGMLRHTLWTGDLGLALYLSSCVRADAAFPSLDVF